MTSSQLAKELKDAGFPVQRCTCGLDSHFKSPTLSELIEACGDGFIALKHYADWTAHGDEETTISHEEENFSLNTSGSTPETAVAMLWIALNKKEV